MSKYVIRAVPSGIKFDLRAANGQVVLSSEVYATRAAALRGIASVRKNAPDARLENQTAPAWHREANPKFELYQDRSGEFRFRLRARNGKIIGVSEGYSARAGAFGGIESVMKNAGTATIEEGE